MNTSPRPQRSTRRLLALVAVLALLISPVVAAVAVFASPMPQPSARTDLEAYPVQVTVNTLSPQVLTGQDSQSVSLTLLNEGPTPVTAPRLGILVSPRPLTTHSALTAWLEANPTATDGVPVETVDIAEPLEPGMARTVVIQVPSTHLGVRPGQRTDVLRGLAIEVIGRKTETGSRVRLGMDRTVTLAAHLEQREAKPLSVILPVTGPFSRPDNPEFEAEQLTSLLTGHGDLAQRLDLLQQNPQLTAAVDPKLLERIANLDTAEANWSNQLLQAISERESLVLPNWDADISALANAGPSGVALLERTLEPNPRFTPANAITSVGLMEGDLLTQSVASGIGQGRLAWLISTQPSARPEVLVDDLRLRELLNQPLIESQPGPQQQEILARSLLYATSSAESTGVVAFGRNDLPDAEQLTSRLSWLNEAPWLSFKGLSPILQARQEAETTQTTAEVEGEGEDQAQTSKDDSDVRATEPTEPPRPLPATVIESVKHAIDEVALVASLTPDPQLLTARIEQQLLPALSRSGRYADAARSLVLSDGLTQASEATNAVHLVPGSVLNLISRSGEVPISLSNSLQQEVTVTVHLEPDHPRLVVKNPVEVTVPAGSTATALLPVEAVGSGNVRVTVSLLNADGLTVVETEPITVRVRADWENVGTVVIGAVLCAGLVFGIIRTARRGRSRHRLSSVSVEQFSHEESTAQSNSQDTSP